MARTRLVAPVESYALLPTIVALAVVGIDRSGLTFPLKAALFSGLFILILVLSEASLRFLVFFAAVVLERSLFLDPVVAYGFGVVIGAQLYLQETPYFQPKIGTVLGIIYTLGLVPLLAPSNIIRWLILPVLLTGLAALLWMLARGTFQISEVAINPRLYLGVTPQNPHNPNRARLAIFCIFFLVLGGPEWSQLVEILDFRIAALIHIAVSLFVPAALLALFELPFQPLQRKEVLPALISDPGFEDRIAALEEGKRLMAREQLLDRERRFFFDQSWDQLAASFANQLETILPDGSVVRASDHLLMGVSSSIEDGGLRYRPVFMHRPILNEHVHILGGTGARKTSQGITPILTQLIREYAVPDDEGGGVKPSEPHPIVILDIKGDLALFHTAREEARLRGQDFLFFTVDHTKASYYFNPFLALRRHKATASEQAHQLLDSLSLNHGEFYGASYFTRIGRQALVQLLRDRETPQSLEDVYQRLKNDPKKQKKAEELFAALEALIFYPQLLTTKKQEEEEPETIIDFDRVLEKNQVVYFSLTAPTQSMAVREIGKLAIYSFFLAAIHRYSNNREFPASVRDCG